MLLIIVQYNIFYTYATHRELYSAQTKRMEGCACEYRIKRKTEVKYQNPEEQAQQQSRQTWLPISPPTWAKMSANAAHTDVYVGST